MPNFNIAYTVFFGSFFDFTNWFLIFIYSLSGFALVGSFLFGEQMTEFGTF